jgi:serine/threonine protein kinase
VVKVSHKKTNIVYAMKIVEKAMLKQTNMVEQMVNEVKIMYSLNHPYILKLYNHFEDDLKIYLVLEIAPGVLYFSNRRVNCMLCCGSSPRRSSTRRHLLR